jgi:NADH-quinone oxidoreductase subunit L
MLVVTGVGTLIHLYAIGYLRGDARFTRFFIYLNLFLVMMLVLVCADNYLMLFAGWEGVGLCSFLLIGFWFDKPGGEGEQNSRAARKAFLVNRVGDFGLLLAIFMIWWSFGSVRFQDVFASAPTQLTPGAPVAVAITLLMVLGAAGKSAQLPLFVWLPDAMAGPTPASALIHAATMVTAGIYVIVRSHILFALAPLTQEVLIVIGTVTALLAANAALGQFDIKRVLAYSTISQLGFMVAAVGLGAYAAGLFHLITHAFFKALLFMGAGSIIHALGYGNDMRRMGGLRSRMPITFWTYTIGALALAGIPPLAGFFSKDEILNHAAASHPFVYVLLSAAALLTAFYTGRQWLTIFWGEARSPAAADAVENSGIFTAPLVALATLTLLAGALSLPGSETLAGWLGHTIGEAEAIPFQLTVAGVSVILSVSGLALAYRLYGRKTAETIWQEPLLLRNERLFDALQHGWWLDTLYEHILIQPYKRLGARLAWADYAAFRRGEGVLMRAYNGLTTWLAGADEVVSLWFDRQINRTTRRAAGWVEQTQTGQLNWNIVGVVGGLALLLIITLWIGGR